MTPLRQRMLDALVLRGMATRTQEAYIDAVARLARHYRCSPDTLTADEVQHYLLHLLRERRLSRSSVNQYGCACRFPSEVPARMHLSKFEKYGLLPQHSLEFLWFLYSSPRFILPGRQSRCPLVTRWWIQLLKAAGSGSRPIAGWIAQWRSSWLPHAGSLNVSPRASTAQAMRAFFAAMATTAFQ